MSRKDTIIIALLVNSALLALLFMLAINTNDEGVIDKPEFTSALSENKEKPINPSNIVAIALPDSRLHDEMDGFLNDLTQDTPQKESLIVDDEGYVLLNSQPPSVVKTNEVKDKVTQDTSSKNKGTYVEITVKRGDALEKIARNNGTTVAAIKKVNNLSSTKLSIGQVLRIPLNDDSVVNPPKVVKPPVNEIVESNPINNNQYYIVKKGDNPWKIAKQFNVSFDSLLSMNNLDEERARNLKIGDKIRVK